MPNTTQFTPASKLREQPWKNGAGSTRDVVTYPDDAERDAVLWRAGILELTADGTLPTWDGMDRILMLIGGGPLTLIREDTAAQTTYEPGARLYWSAETVYRAELHGHSATLFTLLLRQKQAHGCVDMRRGSQQLPLRPGHTVLHCIQGQFEAQLPPRLGGAHTLKAGDTLHIVLDYIPAYRLNLTSQAADSRLVDTRTNLYPNAG
ncbi:MAG: hypothetical protein EPN41_01770 [Candidimonas sp.]|nr:MAG: hypothetical protein EPN41_01770 [Candidimonas sp.]